MRATQRREEEGSQLLVTAAHTTPREHTGHPDSDSVTPPAKVNNRKSAVVVYPGTLKTWEVEVEGSRVQGQPQLHTEFQISLSYVRSCLKNNNSKNRENPK